MRAPVILILLMLGGCVGTDPWLRNGATGNTGEIARDGRGEPLLAGVTPQPAPVETMPPVSLAGKPPTKKVSCQHFRRCL
jgi:hypothetical protein